MSMSSTQWPPIPTSKIFKLAMIQKERIQRGRIDDDLIRLSITGKVDDILQYKTPIKIENIFMKHGTQREVVLIEGAPGSGKSTLALHICQKWAEGKLFQEYDVLVLVRLRDPHIREAKTIADLLPRVNKTMADETEAIIVSLVGRGVLWVLDGWDELPSCLPSDSIINKLIRPDTFQESPLLNSSVIITSRPSSSALLHPLASSRVEVLGFTPHELEQYFRECLKDDSRAVQTLLERIRENPVVEGSCYLPLNAAIVAHVFLSSNHSLPTSNHEIFTSVVKFTLSRYLQDRLHISPEKAVVTTLDKLPLNLKKLFVQLCKLAFFGVAENKITFLVSDLDSAGLSTDICDIGLLQIVPSILVDVPEVYYNFLHLSIQELLAAFHISYMSATKQISVFNELFGNPRFSAVFQYYAGTTKLLTHRPFFSLLPKFLFPDIPRGILDLVSKIVLWRKKSQLVSLLRCLYEAKDPSLCVLVADLLDHFLDLSSTTLRPLDCLSIGYFFSVVSTTVSGKFTVSLYRCFIGDQECKFFVRGFCNQLKAQPRITSIQKGLRLRDNDIREEGVYHIAQLLKDTSVIHKLDLSGNLIGELGLKSLCDALSLNTTLEFLDLSYCIPTASEEIGLSLCQLLSRNTALNKLNLSGCKLLGCHHIAAGLSNNKTLKNLTLVHCNLTDESVEDLFTGLSDYIEVLDIRDNICISENGLKALVRHLTTPCRLNQLFLPQDSAVFINALVCEVNEKRRLIGLLEISCE